MESWRSSVQLLELQRKKPALPLWLEVLGRVLPAARRGAGAAAHSPTHGAAGAQHCSSG